MAITGPHAYTEPSWHRNLRVKRASARARLHRPGRSNITYIDIGAEALLTIITVPKPRPCLHATGGTAIGGLLSTMDVAVGKIGSSRSSCRRPRVARARGGNLVNTSYAKTRTAKDRTGAALITISPTWAQRTLTARSADIYSTASGSHPLHRRTGTHSQRHAHAGARTHTCVQSTLALHI